MKIILTVFLFVLLSLPSLAQTLIPAFPETNGNVHSAQISGDVLYIGGDFTSVDGMARNRAAAIDLATLQVLPWDPDADDVVVDIAVENGVVYLAGQFQMIDGQARNNLAAVDASTGSASSWNPNIAFPGIPGMQLGSITSIVATGDSVFIAGYFISVDGQSISNVAVLRASDGTPYNWDPAPNIPVNKVAVKGDDVYIIGPFMSVGASSNAGIAKIDRFSGMVDPWYPSPDNPGNEWNDILFDGTDVFLAGPFTNLGNVSVNLCAKVDAMGNAYSNWNPGFGFNPQNYQPIRTLAKFQGLIMAGGDFMQLSSGNHFLIGLNAINAQATGWLPGLNARVRDLVTKGDTLIALGDFTSENGNARQGIAAWKGPATALDRRIESQVKVYPNPVTDVLHIEAQAGISRVRLLNISGQVVLARDGDFTGSAQLKLGLANLASGIYLLDVVTENGSFRKKILVR